MLPSKHRINLYKNPCTHTRASFVVSACSSSGEPIISIYNYCGRAAAAAVQGDAKSVRQHHDTAARVCIKIGRGESPRAAKTSKACCNWSDLPQGQSLARISGQEGF